MKANIQLESYYLGSIHPETLFDNADTHSFLLQIDPLCPYCETAYKPQPLSSYHDDQSIYSMLYCPHCCKAYYVNSVIEPNYYDLDIPHNAYAYDILPSPKTKIKIPVEIIDISMRFYDIYQQAVESEKYHLNELAGMGYRKALEFLVRDYCLYKNPDDAEKIQDLPLSQCITKYLQNTQASTLAKASAWIGNDETHYLRQHVDKDINDLKNYLSAFISYVEYELQFEDAFQFIHQSKS